MALQVDDEDVQLVAMAIAKAGWTAPFAFWDTLWKDHKSQTESLKVVLQALVDAKLEEMLWPSSTKKN